MTHGTIDLHVHCARDVRPRKMTAVELARAARAAGLSALLLKNHETSTVPLAATVREVVDGIDVFGSLVLNEAVGGFNPRGVEMALWLGAKARRVPSSVPRISRPLKSPICCELVAKLASANSSSRIRRLCS
jgi:hypothetical protein